MLEQAGLAGAALLMGLAGSPHCVAMCAAPAGGVIRLVRAEPAGCGAAPPSSAAAALPLALFHAGRLTGYAVAGALVAAAAQALGAAGQHVAALQPAMTLLHAGVLAWGLMLLVSGRQPAWAHGIGHALARRLRMQRTAGQGALLAGALWVFMPCGLLYSALALASLGNGPVQGALAMLAFACGSGAALLAAPWLWARLRRHTAPLGERWSARAAGAVLVLLALDALWMDLGRQIARWCGVGAA
ncbi:MAG: sulfite exporter TauE/SafE family protein [Proteobacteria bacterium]|nr:sulfite exporter TauE/SafE family protein [Pseudomonadota bacterium]